MPVTNVRCALFSQTFLLWQLMVFLRTVIGAKKCLFAAGPGAHIVAYVCATGGKTLRVLNGGGDGGSLLELSALRPEDLGGTGKPRRAGEVGEVHNIHLRNCQVQSVAVNFPAGTTAWDLKIVLVIPRPASPLLHRLNLPSLLSHAVLRRESAT